MLKHYSRLQTKCVKFFNAVLARASGQVRDQVHITKVADSAPSSPSVQQGVRCNKGTNRDQKVVQTFPKGKGNETQWGGGC